MLNVYYDKICIAPLLVVCSLHLPKSLNFTYTFKCYQQNCSWLHFSWTTLYIVKWTLRGRPFLVHVGRMKSYYGELLVAVWPPVVPAVSAEGDISPRSSAPVLPAAGPTVPAMFSIPSVTPEPAVSSVNCIYCTCRNDRTRRAHDTTHLLHVASRVSFCCRANHCLYTSSRGPAHWCH